MRPATADAGLCEPFSLYQHAWCHLSSTNLVLVTLVNCPFAAPSLQNCLPMTSRHKMLPLTMLYRAKISFSPLSRSCIPVPPPFASLLLLYAQCHHRGRALLSNLTLCMHYVFVCLSIH